MSGYAQKFYVNTLSRLPGVRWIASVSSRYWSSRDSTVACHPTAHGSSDFRRKNEDRKVFFKTQILYWLLCAIDGHAKNFSLFLEAGGSYRLTPRYDVLSAFPVVGTSKRMLSPKKVKMAMAAEGKNRHYLWHSILGRHWEETAKRCGLGSAFKPLVAELLDRTPGAIDAVSSRLPKGFPDSVASPILDGLRASASRFKL